MRRSIRYLWILVIILLILNLALLYGLNSARLAAIRTLAEIETTLDDLANEVIVYDIEVSQAVPIKADVPFNQTMEIPIDTVIPIDQALTVPFQTAAGEIELEIPLQVDFPLDMVVPVEVNETISLDTVVQLNTTIPVEIDIAQTALAGYLRRARLQVAQLRSHPLLQGKAEAAEEMVIVPAPEGETSVSAAPPSAALTPSPTVSGELSATTEPLAKESLKSDTSSGSPSSSTNPGPSANDPALRPDLGWCEHAYWPLRFGTTWTYNSPDTSYTQGVDSVSNNEVYLSTQYEGGDVQMSLGCYQEGLGGGYLGDMRRMTELGDLQFRSPRGMFLPRLEVIEDIGKTWTQEFEITGAIEGRQGGSPVVGKISRGRAVAVYTPTSFETLETPLGPREALRLEQQLDFELDIDFVLGGQMVPATEIVALNNVYWFVKGIGPVKLHWQGGTLQQGFKIGGTPVNQSFSVPGLTEEYLVSVCVQFEAEAAECMQMAGMSQSDLTAPAVTELDIPGFVFPDDVGSKEGRGMEAETDAPIESSEQPTAVADELPDSPEEDGDDRSALLAYAEAVANLGDKIAQAAETFGEAALAYRDGELTLDIFRNEFLSFSTKVEGLIREIAGLSPPPEAGDIHQKLTGGLDKCDQAVNLMDSWFDTQDSGTKEAAALLVATCIDQVTSAGEELEALVNEN